MIRTPRRLSPILTWLALPAALAVLSAACGGCASRVSPIQREAIRLYDRGEYAEARELLQKLDSEGQATGPLLYRLHYCQVATGQDGAQQTLERAVEHLERELPDAEDLEVPFYLVNAYQNGTRPDDARRVCEETTAAVEQGRIAEPTQAIEMFRLGKLYADLGRSEPATRWYTAALERFDAADAAVGPYVRWASRYLAEPAFLAGDYESAARYYDQVVRGGDSKPADFDRLAVSRYRLGLYKEAAAAWAAAADLENDDPDRLRYASKLAELAASVGELPATAPDGRSWGDMPQADLQAFILEQAQLAKATLEQANQPVSLPDDEVAELRATMHQAKSLFAASALEYAVRGYGIREAAFFGGYARLIFHKQDWRVGQRAGKRGDNGGGKGGGKRGGKRAAAGDDDGS